MKQSQSIKNLIEHFNCLPGIGPKTAERLVFYLLKQPKEFLGAFANSLMQAQINIVKCKICGQISDQNPCPICNDLQRDQTTICVVANTQEIQTIENTGLFSGVYHVLGGLVSPVKGISPTQLNFTRLKERIQQQNAKELILAINPSLDGETTILYLSKEFKNSVLKITKLARGMPIDSDLEYTDEITLSSALKNRQNV